MAEKHLKTRIVNKHDVEANWAKAVNFVPLKGELIVYDADDSHTEPRFKLGDGETKVADLPFQNSVGPQGPKGDAGDDGIATLAFSGSGNGIASASYSEADKTITFSKASFIPESDRIEIVDLTGGI